MHHSTLLRNNADRSNPVWMLMHWRLLIGWWSIADCGLNAGSLIGAPLNTLEKQRGPIKSAGGSRTDSRLLGRRSHQMCTSPINTHESTLTDHIGWRIADCFAIVVGASLAIGCAPHRSTRMNQPGPIKSAGRSQTDSRLWLGRRSRSVCTSPIDTHESTLTDQIGRRIAD